MRIQFLQTVPSGVPEYPFQAGQILRIEAPSPELLALIDGVRAVALRDDEPETATVRAPKRRGRPRTTTVA